jgi:hypothetical protein
MSDEAGFRRYLRETREKALKLASEPHHANEVRECLKDFTELSKQIEVLLDDRSASNVDQRVLQKRFDAAKTDLKVVNQRLEKVKEVFAADVMPAMKAFGAEANIVSEKGQATHDPALTECASRIRAHVKKLVEAFTKI